MVMLKAFDALRPRKQWAKEVAAPPYDVVEKEEAQEIIKQHPYSFLEIDLPELQSKSEGELPYIYAGKRLQERIDEGIFIKDSEALYIYEMETDQVHQYGLVGLISTKDYEEGKIRRHEKTRQVKEQERIWHVRQCQAHTGLVYLIDRSIEKFGEQLKAYTLKHEPLYDVTYDDGVTHRIYKMTEAKIIEYWVEQLKKVPALYIADGHHRAAAAYQVAKQMGKKCEEAQDFLAVIFPKDELKILPYHRIVKDESGYTKSEIFEKLGIAFDVAMVADPLYLPNQPHVFGMRYQGIWYKLSYKIDGVKIQSKKAALDVSILQDEILEPIFGIKQPKEDERLRFIAGKNCERQLNDQTEKAGKVVFSLYPTSVEEVISMADEGEMMPPKSTWFEPKLRSGFLMHRFDERNGE